MIIAFTLTLIILISEATKKIPSQQPQTFLPASSSVEVEKLPPPKLKTKEFVKCPACNGTGWTPPPWYSRNNINDRASAAPRPVCFQCKGAGVIEKTNNE
jgi:hypothetical protein